MVLKDVKTNIKKVGPICYLDKNLNEISNTLQEKYYQYAYIGVRRKGAKIYIDIEKQENYPNINIDQNYICDLVSLEDGKVVGIEVKSGIPLVSINQIISKDDLLVSGNLNYLIDQNNRNNCVKAEGIILVEYAKYEKVLIPKRLEIIKLTNKYERYLIAHIFGKTIGKNRIEYSDYFEVESNVFLSLKQIKISEIICYEKEIKVIEPSFEEAKKLAEKEIYTKFFNEKISLKERIIFVNYIKSDVNNEFYSFDFLVKYVKNVAIERKFEK